VSVEDGTVEDMRDDGDDSLTTTQIAQRALVVVGIALVALGLALGFLPASVGSLSCGSPWLPASPADATAPSGLGSAASVLNGLSGVVCLQALGDRGTTAAIVGVLGASFVLTALYLAVPRRR
jgi:hypothetical protein